MARAVSVSTFTLSAVQFRSAAAKRCSADTNTSDSYARIAVPFTVTALDFGLVGVMSEVGVFVGALVHALLADFFPPRFCGFVFNHIVE